MPTKTEAPAIVPAASNEFSLSNTQAPEADAGARAALDAALASFNSAPTIQGTVAGSINTAPTAEVIDSEELSPELQQPEQEDEEETDTEETDETEELEPGAFDQEFSKRFGVKPEEALETINSLLAFRDEMTLMRGWGVSPAEYDSRMTAVKEFYSTLPEDKQPEFNSLEGAKAIWEHLEKTNPSLSKKKSSTASKIGGSKKPASVQPKQTFINKSEILRMSPEEYNKRLPEITLAFKQGRVREDA